MATPGLSSAKPIKVSGNISLLASSNPRYDPSPDIRPELKIKTKRIMDVRGVLKIEASVYDRELYIKDGYIDYKINKKLKLTLGMSKKIIGLEFQNSKKKRLSIYRSPIYAKMQDLGMVGRQINLRLIRKPKNRSNGLYLETAVGTNGSRDYNIQLSARHKIDNFGYGAWLLLEYHRVDPHIIDGGYIPVMGESVAIWYKSNQGSISLEFFHGVDSYKTEFAKTFGNNKTVYFAGPKLDASINYNVGSNLVVSPIFQSSFWVDDIKNPGSNTISFLSGINLKFTNGIQLSFNAETQGELTIINPDRRSFNKRNYYGAIRYFF